MEGPDGGETDSPSRIRHGVLAAALYAVLLLLMAYPLSVHPASMTAPGDPDTDLFMWTLGWNTHALQAPWAIFDANIYYPHRYTLAFSENLIGSTLFAAPVLWLGGSPVLALNVVSFTSIVLSGAGAWLLARRLGAGQAGAVLAGLIFAFSPARFLRIGQLHLTTIQWIPFSLAFLHAYLNGGRKRNLRLAVGFFALQVLTSGHGATFLTVAIVSLLAYRFALGEPLSLRQRVCDLGIPGVLLMVPALLILLPYRAVQLEHGLRRDLVDWAPSPESFIASPSIVHLWMLSYFPRPQIVEQASAWLFPGILPLLLSLAALLPGIRAGATAVTWRRVTEGALNLAICATLALAVWAAVQGPVRLAAGTTVLFSAREPYRLLIVFGLLLALRLAMLPRRGAVARIRAWGAEVRDRLKGRRSSPVTFYGLLLVVSVLFAAGPPIGVWPLVYALPGFNFIRVPSRFVLLGVLALAVLAAFGFQRLTARLPARRRQALAAALGVLMVAEFLTIPIPAARPTRVEIPSADRWLAAQPMPFAVVEVPTTTYERLQSTYMLHSMAHWQKTVNGYSGLRTTFHKDLFDRLRRFPDADLLRQLVELGITYIVVHPALYEPYQWTEVEAAIQRHGQLLQLVHEDGEDRVYRLRSPQSAD